jgi:hypothetical protein
MERRTNNKNFSRSSGEGVKEKKQAFAFPQELIRIKGCDKVQLSHRRIQLP